MKKNESNDQLEAKTSFKITVDKNVQSEAKRRLFFNEVLKHRDNNF